MPMRRCETKNLLGIYSNPDPADDGGGGILQEEFPSPASPLSGGPFLVVQLWVNLPNGERHAV
jgi:hypothetical protein